jgi:two-component sensor histidine kinase
VRMLRGNPQRDRQGDPSQVVRKSRASDGRLVLRWIETGGQPVRPPTRQGFGTRVMESMIRGHLKSEMHFDWRSEGTRV